MENKVYTALQQHDGDVAPSIIESQVDPTRAHRSPSSEGRGWIWVRVLCALLVLSLAGNAYLIHRQFLKPWTLANELPTQFAHLKRDFPMSYGTHKLYESANRTIQEEAWSDSNLDPWNLYVALDDDYSASVGLPSSQRWPWDAGKGGYLLTAAHEMHCVRILRTVVNELQDGLSQDQQTWPYSHSLHCLNALREAVMCNADDTPLYTGRLHWNRLQADPKSGGGTIKMCRNWDALVSWAKERSACYRPVHRFDVGFNRIDRYKFCPDNSTPWE